MATALTWEHATGLPPEIDRLLGPGCDVLLRLAEHKVALPGRGGASQSDVFVFAYTPTGRVAVAIEAKVDEPFDQPLSQWLAKGASNRRDRLAGLCEILGRSGTMPPPSLYYQLFHRTAAAVVEARRFGFPRAAMIVQSFSPTHKWLDAFAAFSRFIGAETGLDKAADCTLEDGLRLTLGWAHSPIPAKDARPTNTDAQERR